MLSINNFSSQVFNKFSKIITDQVFLMIQNDRVLMKKYLDLITAKGLGEVNRSIGKAVKNRYRLSNSDLRQKNPKSSLIQSHQEFK